MNRDIVKTIDIKATAAKIWQVLTTPECIEIYLPGAHAYTDWQVGHSIAFVHTDREPHLVDKGTILVYEPPKLLVFTYWTPLADLADSPDNYTTVGFNITEADTATELTITHVNFKSEAWHEASFRIWDQLLLRVALLCEEEAP